MEPTAEQIAAGARARGAELSERLALYADALADALARQLQLVAWDREQLVGQVQARVAALHRERPSVREGAPVRVVERRRQPLESVDTVWRWLRKGRRVRLEHEPGACTAAADLLRGLASALPPAVLDVGGEATERPPTGYIDGGVASPGPRVAVIDATADRELAAYVLARTGLRRSGIDPRGVKVAYTAGELELLERHMRRLWVGVQIGPAADPASFCGPVSAELREQFLAAQERWRAHPEVTTWCPGGVLERTGDVGGYLAPALFCAAWPCPELPVIGPMVVVVTCDDPALLRDGAEAAHRKRGQVVQIGGRPGSIPGEVRSIRGALLVERLPPGLPEPRPV